ncbi:MAG: hypothetical protein ACKVQA_26490, partial [Burkholderiales bacterium]
GGDHAITVAGTLDISAGGSRTDTVGGDHATQVTGSGTFRYGGSRQLHVTGDDAQTVEGGRMTDVTGRMQTIVRAAEGDNAFCQVIVQGRHALVARTESHSSAGEKLTLSVGSSSLVLTPEEIVVRGKKLRFVAEETVLSKVGDSEVTVSVDAVTTTAATIQQATSGAGLKLDGSAVLHGAQISLSGSGDTVAATDDEVKTESGTVTFHVEPPPGTSGPLTLVIVTPSGEIVERDTDGNNQVKLEGEPGGQYTLLEVRRQGQGTGYWPSGSGGTS